MIPPWAGPLLSALLFGLGVAAFFVKRDLISQFLAVEVMLAGGSLAFLTLPRPVGSADGQIMVVFVITVAAAEAAVGLAAILHAVRRRKTVRGADLKSLRG